MSDQLTTTAAVKLRLGMTDTDDDALLSSLIDQVTAWMSEFTGRKLVPEAGATYVVDTIAGNVIYLPRGIRSVTTLGVASSTQPETGGTYTTVSSSAFVLRPSPAERKPGMVADRIELLGTWPVLRTVYNGASILGDWGPATPDPSLVGIATDAVVAAYTSRRAGASGVIGAEDQAVAPWNQFFGAGSPQRATLNRWRAGRAMGIA